MPLNGTMLLFARLIWQARVFGQRGRLLPQKSLLASGIESNPSLEILFDETQYLNIPHTDLEPHGEYRDWKCYWSFDSGRESTRCGKMRYRHLDNSCVEHGLHYARDEVHGIASDLIV